MLLEEQLRFAPEGLPQVVVEVREHPRVRARRRQVAQVQPLPGEVRDQRFRATVGQHPLHLLFEHRRLVQLPGGGQIEQFLVRDAAPQEKGQARGELQIADAIGGVGRGVARIPFDAEEKLRAGENGSNRHLDAGVETAGRSRRLVELQRSLEVRRGDRPPVGAARQGRDDGLRARGFRRRARPLTWGPAHEEPLAARRLGRIRPRRTVRRSRPNTPRAGFADAGPC